MPDTDSHAEFSHSLHDAQNILKGLKGEVIAVSTDVESHIVKKALRDDLLHMFDEILKDVSFGGTPDPLAIMDKALAGLSKVEAKTFFLQNLLEAIKEGKKPVEIVTRYHDLGLAEIPLPVSNLGEEAVGAANNTQGFGKLIQNFLKKLKQVAVTLVSIVVSALKVIPKFAGIKPSIGLVAGFPSLSFELEAEAINVAELLEAIRGGFDSSS